MKGFLRRRFSIITFASAKPMNNTNFGKEVKRSFPAVHKERPNTIGRRLQIYGGLAFRALKKAISVVLMAIGSYFDFLKVRDY